MKLKLLFLMAFFVLWAFIACSSPESEEEPGNSSSSGGNGNPSSSGGGSTEGWTGWPFDASGENLQATPACPDYENPIEIIYKDGDSPEIINPHTANVTVDKNGENVTVTLTGTTEYNLVLSGTAQNGSLKVFGNDQIRLYLDGVNIKNNSGPAINIQKSTGKGRVKVCLMSSKENYLDGKSAEDQGNEQAKGAFFSEEKLSFTGNGSLEVKSRLGHAIVVDNDIEIENGKIIISEAEVDGIHANDSIKIEGGVIKIASKGDALQSEDKSIVISGGKILAQTTGVKSHGIVSEANITIKEGANIQISVLGNGSKGMKSTKLTEIFGGTIAIKASGSRHGNDDADSSTAAGMKVDANLYIDGGNLTIKSPGSKAKGINTSGDIVMTEGNVDVEADDDGIKIHGYLRMSGGSIKVASKNKDEIDVEPDKKQKTGGTINGQ